MEVRARGHYDERRSRWLFQTRPMHHASWLYFLAMGRAHEPHLRAGCSGTQAVPQSQLLVTSELAACLVAVFCMGSSRLLQGTCSFWPAALAVTPPPSVPRGGMFSTAGHAAHPTRCAPYCNSPQPASQPAKLHHNVSRRADWLEPSRSAYLG